MIYANVASLRLTTPARRASRRQVRRPRKKETRPLFGRDLYGFLSSSPREMCGAAGAGAKPVPRKTWALAWTAAPPPIKRVLGI